MPKVTLYVSDEFAKVLVRFKRSLEGSLSAAFEKMVRDKMKTSGKREKRS